MQSKKLRIGCLLFAVTVISLWGLLLWFGRAPCEPNSDLEGLKFHLGDFSRQSSSRLLKTLPTRNGWAKISRCNRVHIHNLNGSPLMIMVGEKLAKRIREDCPWVDEVILLQAGQESRIGQRAPDLTFFLDLENLRESGVVWVKLQGDFLLYGGTGLPVQKMKQTFDQWSPDSMTLDFEFHEEVKYSFAGVTTEAGFYDQVANDIAIQMALYLNLVVKDNRKGSMRFPSLTDDFYPAYEAPALPECFARFKPTLMLSDHGYMESCRALWKFESKESYQKVMRMIAESMEKDGWRVPESDFDFGTQGFRMQDFRMKKGEDLFNVFMDYQDMQKIDSAKSDRVSSVEDCDAKGPDEVCAKGVTYYIEYHNRVSQAEQDRAIETVLGSDTPLEMLLLLVRKARGQSQKEIVKRLEASYACRPEALFALANYYADHDKEKAKKFLHRCWVLNYLKGGWGIRYIHYGMRKLGRKIGAEFMSVEKYSYDMEDVPVLEELGFLQMPFAEVPERLPISPDRPVGFFGFDEFGNFFICTAEMVSSDVESGQNLHVFYRQQSLDACRCSDELVGSFSLDPKEAGVKCTIQLKQSEISPEGGTPEYYLELTSGS